MYDEHRSSMPLFVARRTLLMLECHFSWHAQYFVKLWEIAGARNVAILTQNAFRDGKGKLSERGCDDEFMVTNFGAMQYLVMLEGDCRCCGHSTAIFGDGVSLSVARQLHWTSHV